MKIKDKVKTTVVIAIAVLVLGLGLPIEASSLNMAIRGNCRIEEADVQDVFDLIADSADGDVSLMVKSVTGSGSIAVTGLPDGAPDAEAHGKYTLEAVLSCVSGEWMLTVAGYKNRGKPSEVCFIEDQVLLDLELGSGGEWVFTSKPSALNRNIRLHYYASTNRLILQSKYNGVVLRWDYISEQEAEAWLKLAKVIGLRITQH